MSLTNAPIVFISRFEVLPGHLDALRSLWASVVVALDTAKPRTSVFLGFLSDGGADLTIVHVFPDGVAMEAHFRGADERSRAAYEHVRPAGWEVYGETPAEILAQLGESALAAGVDLTIQRDPLGGFLRTAE